MDNKEVLLTQEGYDNIEKDILKDKVIIESLIGNNGEISEKEYKNILDKTRYLA